MTSPNLQTPPQQQTQPKPKEATDLLGVLGKEVAVQSKTEETEDDKKWQYVHWCQRGHIAFFYEKNPATIGQCHPTDWFATYKKRGEPWRGEVLCQVCTTIDKNGLIEHEHPAMVTYIRAPRNTVIFTPITDYVWRYPKDESLRSQIPVHRAARLDRESANYGNPNPDFRKSHEELRREEIHKELDRNRKLVEGNVHG